jgi:hypothetical protein
MGNMEGQALVCRYCGKGFVGLEYFDHLLNEQMKLRKSREQTLQSQYPLQIDSKVLALLRSPDTYDDAAVISKLIDDRLFISNIDCALNTQILQDNHIKFVVDCTQDMPNDQQMRLYSRLGIKSFHVKLQDSSDFEIRPHFDAIFKFIDDTSLNRGNDEQVVQDIADRVLVHCIAGVSRSAAVVIGYLIHRGKSLREAALEVRAARRCAYPNSGFFKALLDYEFEKKGTRSIPEAILQLHDEILENS